MTYKEKYRKYFDYGIDDYVPCEICSKPAVDVHHITYRSHGGTDDITNLMALCRRCHNKAHENKVHKTVFEVRHKLFMENRI